MILLLETQFAVTRSGLPSQTDFQRWAEAALKGRRQRAELVIRVVGEQEMADLNQCYRHKTGATNVLSFPFQAPPPAMSDLLGDLVICDAVVEREAREQGKPERDHWAHLTVHGVLHLQGFDHQDPIGAERMEALERAILAKLGIPDPYAPRDQAV